MFRIVTTVFALAMPLVSAAATLTPVSPSLQKPWGLSFIDSQSALVTEKSGALYRVNISTGDKSLVTGSPQVNSSGQGGLLDVLYHDGHVFICFAQPNADGSRTAIFKGLLKRDALENPSTIWRAEPSVSGFGHYGCRLDIDQQGYLFASSGERRARALVQDPSNAVGSVIRLNQDGSVPASNPFYPSATYSYGHRNPQGLALRPGEANQIWTHEHGPAGGDEVNLIKAGANYGWPRVSHGTEYFGWSVGDGKSSAPGYENPKWHWTPSIAPSGMVFDGPNTLYVGALKYELVMKLTLQGDTIVSQDLVFQGDIGRVRDIERAPDGRLYVINDSPKGAIFRLDL